MELQFFPVFWELQCIIYITYPTRVSPFQSSELHSLVDFVTGQPHKAAHHFREGGKMPSSWMLFCLHWLDDGNLNYSPWTVPLKWWLDINTGYLVTLVSVELSFRCLRRKACISLHPAVFLVYHCSSRSCSDTWNLPQLDWEYSPGFSRIKLFCATAELSCAPQGRYLVVPWAEQTQERPSWALEIAISWFALMMIISWKQCILL